MGLCAIREFLNKAKFRLNDTKVLLSLNANFDSPTIFPIKKFGGISLLFFRSVPIIVRFFYVNILCGISTDESQLSTIFLPVP